MSDTATNAAIGTADSSSHELRPGWTVGGGMGMDGDAALEHEGGVSPRRPLTDQHVFPGTPRAVSTHNHRFTENLLVRLNYHLP